ncbi:MAG: DVU0298 family protein [Desulfovibrionaceae bacterium]
MARFRRLKLELRGELAAPDWAARLDARAAADGAEPLVGPLLALRLDRETLVRWRAVEGLGRLAARLADATPERARVLVRTFMWYLNEESGNLGWGIPDAMGEATARSPRLAAEYGSILASYIADEPGLDGNFLDHAELRRGACWGLGRLAEARPERVRPWARFLVRGLADADAGIRGLCARTLGVLARTTPAGSADEGAADVRGAAPALAALADDGAELEFYDGTAVRRVRVGELAAAALAALEGAAG